MTGAPQWIAKHQSNRGRAAPEVRKAARVNTTFINNDGGFGHDDDDDDSYDVPYDDDCRYEIPGTIRYLTCEISGSMSYQEVRDTRKYEIRGLRVIRKYEIPGRTMNNLNDSDERHEMNKCDNRMRLLNKMSE